MRTDKQQAEYVLRLRDETLAKRKSAKKLLIRAASVAACFVLLCAAVLVSVPVLLSANSKDSGNAGDEGYISCGTEKSYVGNNAIYYPVYTVSEPSTDGDSITYGKNWLYVTAIEYNGIKYLPSEEITESDGISDFLGEATVGILCPDGEKTKNCEIFKASEKSPSEAVAVKTGKIYILYRRCDAIK